MNDIVLRTEHLTKDFAGRRIEHIEWFATRTFGRLTIDEVPERLVAKSREIFLRALAIGLGDRLRGRGFDGTRVAHSAASFFRSS
jgi:hypothetical protein